jgi:uncharacterized membrane protein YqhA
MQQTDFQELRKSIFANGKIDDDDVKVLREVLLGDGAMTREKGNFLFDIKDSTNRNNQCSAFKELFVEAITIMLLEDDNSPGEISDDEAKWLRAKIRFKGYTDKTDDMLINNLKRKSINWPKILSFKSKTAKSFEKTLYFSRYLTLLSVIGSLVSAVVLFVYGTINVYVAFRGFLSHPVGRSHADLGNLLAVFVSSVDVYLFAMVLIIFGMGVYELFISKIDPVETKLDSRPSWLRITSIDDLKSSLGKVILMVLIVSVFEHSLSINYDQPIDLLYASVAVVLVALALYVTHLSNHKEDAGKKGLKRREPEEETQA